MRLEPREKRRSRAAEAAEGDQEMKVSSTGLGTRALAGMATRQLETDPGLQGRESEPADAVSLCSALPNA